MVQTGNNQTGKRRKLNKIKTEEEEQFLSRCHKVNHPGTLSAALKHLLVTWTSYIFQIILQQTYGESDHPWKLRDLRFHAVASSLQGEELWNIAICPSPAWHLALERARAPKVALRTQVSKSINLNRPSCEENVCTGSEPWDHIQGSQMSLSVKSLKLKSRCPVATSRHQISGLKIFR